ncbi:hypothetical protein TH53_19015 [Pedobacter lusitanus]|uniref:DUF4468 domain-containing protein n=1 Tax=Pedobacter lusitanus TaxID=1503925 RepID=A0A0D0FTF4_9SPHI|nr:hypothetical protein TH53_19015 [Pedobacter lusitanus]
MLTVSLASTAQIKKTGEVLEKDERGKYIHYEVITGNSVPVDSLIYRAKLFFKQKKLTGIKSDSTFFERSGRFIINKTAFVLSHPSGELWYNLTFEIKGEKYRFWLTDFVFIPYHRDRYGNFVPSTVKGSPLEKSPGKLNAGEWSFYVSDAGRQSAAFAAEFKEYLSAVQQAKPLNKPAGTVSTKSW